MLSPATPLLPSRGGVWIDAASASPVISHLLLCSAPSGPGDLLLFVLSVCPIAVPIVISVRDNSSDSAPVRKAPSKPKFTGHKVQTHFLLWLYLLSVSHVLYSPVSSTPSLTGL